MRWVFHHLHQAKHTASTNNVTISMTLLAKNIIQSKQNSVPSGQNVIQFVLIRMQTAG